MKNLVIDLDGTLTIDEKSEYSNKQPQERIIAQLHKYRNKGFKIIIYTSRNMRTYNGNIGMINIHTLPDIIDWLDKYNVPYDEIIAGKPWCGFDGFYVDDKAIRPSEFSKMSYGQIQELLINESQYKENEKK